VVGLVGAAGGQSSYMSLMPIANSLMLDFRCVIVPRYVYASKRCFQDGQLRDPAVVERLVRLARDLVQFADALGPVLRNT
jgi:FMN reductase